MRLGSVTHQFDMDQRFVELGFTELDADTIEVEMPQDAGEMPPGWNMLFVLTDRDVPQTYLDLASSSGSPTPGVPSQGHYLRLNLE
ncbi:MAG: galactose oxidase early set domain-containing protein [Nannocystaceae bacterium]|nr:galactose oxidase early set domain-containing protein [bacterium]